ncbi:MAG: hypothetical protein MRJ65_11055 [Candidatus Brocadiaceae bacterium]|nr:hypothetical protein [Candidatus Brocadiaceae bacterium]
MSKILIVFEFKDEVEFFISQRTVEELRDKNIFILALHPESQVCLKKRGLSYLTSHHFFGGKSHQNLLLKSDEILTRIRALPAIVDDLGIEEGYNNSFAFYTRFFLHHILWLIEVIEHACKRLKIEKLICFYGGQKHITDPFLSNTERYVSEVGKRVADELNIDFESYQVQKKHQHLLFDVLKKQLKEIVKYGIFHIKFYCLPLAIKNNKIILAASRSYNLDRVLNGFEQAFNNVSVVCLGNKKGGFLQKLLSVVTINETFILPSILAPKKKNKFQADLVDYVSALEVCKESSEIFLYKNILFKDMLFKKIRRDIIPTFCEIYSQSMYMDKFLRRYRPSLVISQSSRGIEYNLGELAFIHKIPSLLISHGSHVPPKSKYEMIEWREHGYGMINSHYQYVAVQSPWAKAYIECVPIRSEQIITGPLLFAKNREDKKDKEFLRENIIPGHKDKRILLHADTPKLRGSFRFYVYNTVDEYIYNINALIKAVEKMEDFHLIIRFRPVYYLSTEQFINLLSESDCYSVHTEGSFEEYLSMADMLVSYSSTAIEEALQNRVPVLLFDSDGKYCHIKDAQVLDPSLKIAVNSCYYANKARLLGWALQWLRDNHFLHEVPASLWDRHVFDSREKVDLTSFFRASFCK